MGTAKALDCWLRTNHITAMQDEETMAYLIRDVAPGSFIPSKRTRRQDDETGGGDFARWMSGAVEANDEVPVRPLTQTPMTSIEDMLLLARAREQIESSYIVEHHPLDAYTAQDTGTEMIDADQYAFDFMKAAGHIDQRI